MRDRQFACILAGVFVVVFPIRLALALMVAPEIPFYDEWDAVVDGIARPLLAGDFSARYLFEPHNEHVLLWTKGLSYLMLRAGDLQFDNVPVCEASQFIYSVIVAALIALAATAIDDGNVGTAGRRQAKWWYVASTGIAAVLPYGWENIGVGLGNSYYFLIAFSAATIILASILRGSIGGLALLGVLAMGAGVSMGSGFFAGIAGLLALVLRVRIGRLSARDAGRAAVVLLAAIALTAALVIRPGRMPIEWGLLQSAELLLMLLLLLPVWFLLARVWRGQGSNADVAFICVAVWGLMQVSAILLGRPAFRLWYPISRYVDVLALTAFAGIGCLCRLASAEPVPRVWTVLSRVAMAATIVFTLVFAPFAWQAMNLRADHQREQTGRVIWILPLATMLGLLIVTAPRRRVPAPA